MEPTIWAFSSTLSSVGHINDLCDYFVTPNFNYSRFCARCSMGYLWLLGCYALSYSPQTQIHLKGYRVGGTMLKDIATWRVVYYIVSYFAGSILAYFGQLCYYKGNRWRILSGFFAALFILLGIFMLCVIFSSPHISIIAGFGLAVVWGTAGYGTVILYYIRRKSEK